MQLPPQIVLVKGMKRSKGEMDGVSYDSTKVFIETNLDASKSNAWGSATQDYGLGTSVEFEKYPQHEFKAEVVFDLVSNGKTSKLVVVSLKPMLESKKAA